MIQGIAASSVMKGAGEALKAIPREVYIGLGILVVVSFIWGKVTKAAQKGRAKKASRDLGSNTASGRAVEYASRLYGSFILVSEWMNDSVGDGTFEKEAYRAAAAIGKDKQVSFRLVADKYKKIHGRSLNQDINGNLKPSEKKIFFKALRTGLLPRNL
ncbi:MAG: hypothetical protein AAFQ94_09210 [Bacteroidota bacterium]